MEENGRSVAEGVHLHCRSALVELANADLDVFIAMYVVCDCLREVEEEPAPTCSQSPNANGASMIFRDGRVRINSGAKIRPGHAALARRETSLRYS